MLVGDIAIMAFVYMLKCSDGSYYVGSTRASLEARFAEHLVGRYVGYTASRPPLTLVWSQEFTVITDAIATERRIKGWSRAKKKALVDGDFARLRLLAKRRKTSLSSFETQALPAPQDEAGT